VDPGDTGWHVGNSFYNERMIGIEHVGYAGLDDYQTPLYEKSADLVRSIAKRHQLMRTESVEDSRRRRDRGGGAWGPALSSGECDHERQDKEGHAVAEPRERAHRATSPQGYSPRLSDATTPTSLSQRSERKTMSCSSS